MPVSLTPALAARASAAGDLLARIAREHAPVVFASSFGAEDMVVLDLIASAGLAVRVITLDTGRLPQETHDLIDRVRSRYGIAVDVYAPDAEAVQAYVRANGTNAFFNSLELRQSCCDIRKMEPLRRALSGAQAWVTGLRRAQSVTRAEIAIEEHDTRHGIRKFNPLADWSEDDVWSYLRDRNVPWNALHDRGYPSIGCAPCTRAIEPGEDVRAGRWWWENPEHKECGLHRRPVSRVRVVSIAAAQGS
jgi:phosphoadenosine phosphosulfate reductase